MFVTPECLILLPHEMTEWSHYLRQWGHMSGAAGKGDW